MRKMRSSGKISCSVRFSSMRRLEVAPERLLDDDAAALVEPDRRQLLGDGREHVRRDRHVEHGDLASRSWSSVSASDCHVVRRRVVALDEVEPPAHVVDDGLVGVLDVGDDRLPGVGPEVVVGPVAAGDADDRHLQLAAPHEVVERREQLALGEVAGGAEQHEGVGRAAGARAVVSCASVIGWTPFRSTWPPNPARIADSTLSATSARPRELKRWNSAADSTGTGTPSSMAALIVQRPSPESLTWPSKASRWGSAASASAVRSSSQLATTEPRRHTSVIAARSRS